VQNLTAHKNAGYNVHISFTLPPTEKTMSKKTLERLTEDQAKRVYAALVTHADASTDELSVMSFVHEFTHEKPTHEYRFQGGLGYGGKLRFPGLTVDTYPPEKYDPPAVTARREQMVLATNAALAVLREEFLAEQA
jgi:hypothetical protein